MCELHHHPWDLPTGLDCTGIGDQHARVFLASALGDQHDRDDSAARQDNEGKQ